MTNATKFNTFATSKKYEGPMCPISNEQVVALFSKSSAGAAKDFGLFTQFLGNEKVQFFITAGGALAVVGKAQ